MNEQPEKEVAPDAQDGSVFENQRADAFPSSKSATREARREWCSRIRPEPHQPDSDESSGLDARSFFQGEDYLRGVRPVQFSSVTFWACPVSIEMVKWSRYGT